ncbi:MAG: GNAT family N-acetyltransferase [Desulfatibacillaceae bacterium]
MPEPRFITRPTAGEIDQVTSLYREAGWWEGPDDPEQVGGIVRGSHCFLVLEEDGAVVAMGRAISDGVSDAYIQDLAVRETHRGRGLGSELVRLLSERVNADGLYWIGLIAERGTEGFYQRLGFSRMPDSVPMLRK